MLTVVLLCPQWIHASVGLMSLPELFDISQAAKLFLSFKNPSPAFVAYEATIGSQSNVVP